jgi:hypothetical protein
MMWTTTMTAVMRVLPTRPDGAYYQPGPGCRTVRTPTASPTRPVPGGLPPARRGAGPYRS